MRRRSMRREAVATAVAWRGSASPSPRSAPGRRIPVGHSILTAALLVLCYAAAARVQFEVGAGVAVLTQLVFVPMLFLARRPLVPLLVALGYALSALPAPPARRLAPGPPRPAPRQLLVRDRAGARARAAGPGPAPSPRTAAVVAAALAAQFVRFARRQRGPRSVDSPRGRLRALGRRLAGRPRADPPLALALATPVAATHYALPARAAAGRPAGLVRPRAHGSGSTRPSSSPRPTGAPPSCSATWSRPTTPTPGCTAATSSCSSLAVADRLGLDADQRRNAELAALLHDVGKVAMPNEIINKPGPLTPDEREIIETHTIEGERMLERVGGLLGRRRRARPLLPRALGRRRLSRRAGRRGDPARRPHRLRLRRLQRDDHRPLATGAAMTHEARVAELRRCAGRSSTPRSWTRSSPVAGGVSLAVSNGPHRPLPRLPPGAKIAPPAGGGDGPRRPGGPRLQGVG